MSRASAEGSARARRNSGPKKGDYRNGKKEQWNGSKWVPVNVVHAGQRAVKNGKPVVADGNGNWRPVGGSNRTPVGTYRTGQNRTPAEPSSSSSSAYSSEKIKKNRISSEGKAKAVASNLASRTKSDKPGKPGNPGKRVKPAKPAATKHVAKPSRPNPRMTGEGAPRPNDLKVGNKSTANKVSRLAKALSDKKGMKSYMDRLRQKK